MQSKAMKQEEIEALAREMAKGVKTEADLEAVTRTLTKTLIETALKAEMTDHLGYEAHDPAVHCSHDAQQPELCRLEGSQNGGG
ncbi:MAG: hypothetical protein IIA07_13350 [Proteobacteria bacterium]|nr:hypothetical protein [Pseudomonadota bacterium]